MIPELLLLALLATTSPLPAGEGQGEGAIKSSEETGKQEAPTDDPTLDRHRTPFEALTERMIGTASKSVRFDWRKSPVSLGVVGSELLERNNFGSNRLGLFVRKPLGNFVGELAITHAFTWGTDSTQKLGLTPYRQFARPNRFELDVNVGMPLAEGVVTAFPSWFPATELVFSADAGFRYLFYPGSLGGADFFEIAQAVLAPRLSELELQRLEPARLRGMQIDPSRYGVLAGFSTDLYFQTGGFISPRIMVGIPILSGLTGSGLGWWWELSLGLGWAL